MIDFGLISNLSASIIFCVLLVLLLINWRGQVVGGLLICSCLMSIIFFSGAAYNSSIGSLPVSFLYFLELARDVSWLVFLVKIVNYQPSTSTSVMRKYMLPFLIGSATVVILASIVWSYNLISIPKPDFISIDSMYYGYLFISLLGLVLIEQIYRNTKVSYRWTIKFLCIGLGGIFAYDFFIYSDAILFKRVNPDLLYARGIINALSVPLIAVSVKRVRDWNMELFISRHVVFQSSIALLAGLYLSFMAISGYYVRIFGGTWGGALQTVFVFTAILGLLVMFFSADLRARIGIFLAKHFYENKYDYRDEWLGFTHMLADNQGEGDVYKIIIRAFAKTMKCKGGAIWLQDKNGKSFECVGDLHLKEALQIDIPTSSGLILFLSDKQWVININNYIKNPQRYGNVLLPESFNKLSGISLLIPLFNENIMFGVVLLTQSDINVTYNWEDYDLLKTMGRQAANFIAMLRATEDLTEAKQFEAFNRLSAFVVHDMKNIAAQLSLVSSNAKKFKSNPKFLEDAFDTIDNAVTKMNRLTMNLKKDALRNIQSKERVDIESVIKNVIKLRESDMPSPIIKECESQLTIRADRDRFTTVIEHIVQNAQQATPEDGTIEIFLQRKGGMAEIKITDTGCGMDADFIRNRLFKPFDTTKGNAGMGIGVYESRHLIEEMGGKIEVESTPNEGTMFRIYLPLIKQDKVNR